MRIRFLSTITVLAFSLTLLSYGDAIGLPTLRIAKSEIGNEKISATLQGVVDQVLAASRQGPSSTSLFSTPLVQVDSFGRIQLYIHTNSWVDENLNQLTANGLDIEIANKTNRIIQGWASANKIQTLSQLSFVKRIAAPSYATHHKGSATTAGYTILHASEFQALGFDGTGVKVGIISDGGDNWEDAAATSDLPSSVTIYGTCTAPTTCNEGTAMAEIIHDLAPGAELAIGSLGTSLDFIQRITDLKDTFGADIIVDDVGFLLEPHFEDGAVAQAVADVVDDLIYVSAAGNGATYTYEKTFVPVANFHDFGTANGGGSDNTMNLGLPAGGTITVYLQWNDQFGASGNNYDVALFNSDASVQLAASTIVQDGDDDPLEAFSYTNPSGSDVQVRLAVQKTTGTEKILDLFISGALILEYGTAGNSIFGHAAVPGALAVAAIDANDPGHDTIEPFSSHGPVEIFFPTPETRAKPDITAVDGVFVTGAGGFSSPFFGTSAAAPHIAGLAALLLDAFDTATGEEVRNALVNNAVDIGEVGVDSSSGSGRADVMRAGVTISSAPESTIAAPTSQQSIEAGESVTFSGSCVDADNTMGMKYLWDFGASGVADMTVQNPGSIVFSTTGTHTITLTCTNGFDLPDATPDSVIVEVTAATGAATSTGGGSGGCQVGTNGDPISTSLLLAGLLLFAGRVRSGWRQRRNAFLMNRAMNLKRSFHP